MKRLVCKELLWFVSICNKLSEIIVAIYKETMIINNRILTLSPGLFEMHLQGLTSFIGNYCLIIIQIMYFIYFFSFKYNVGNQY